MEKRCTKEFFFYLILEFLMQQLLTVSMKLLWIYWKVIRQIFFLLSSAHFQHFQFDTFLVVVDVRSCDRTRSAQHFLFCSTTWFRCFVCAQNWSIFMHETLKLLKFNCQHGDDETIDIQLSNCHLLISFTIFEVCWDVGGSIEEIVMLMLKSREHVCQLGKLQNDLLELFLICFNFISIAPCQLQIAS